MINQDLRKNRTKKIFNDDIIKCKSCNCSWMSEIEVKQFRENHSIILGQHIPSYRDNIFYILKCVKCGELHEPHIQIGFHDSFYSSYEDFLNSMESKNIISERHNEINKLQ